MSTPRFRTLLAVGALAALAPDAVACPTCRDALAEADARWALGFAESIAFLLSALALVTGGLAWAVRRAVRG